MVLTMDSYLSLLWYVYALVHSNTNSLNVYTLRSDITFAHRVFYVLMLVSHMFSSSLDHHTVTCMSTYA